MDGIDLWTQIASDIKCESYASLSANARKYFDSVVAFPLVVSKTHPIFVAVVRK